MESVGGHGHDGHQVDGHPGQEQTGSGWEWCGGTFLCNVVEQLHDSGENWAEKDRDYHKQNPDNKPMKRIRLVPNSAVQGGFIFDNCDFLKLRIDKYYK